MLSSVTVTLLDTASSILEQLKSVLLADQLEQERLDSLLVEHQDLFEAFFAQNHDLSSDDKQAIEKHIEKMQHLIVECENNKITINRRIGAIRRSEKVNKAYGK